MWTTGSAIASSDVGSSHIGDRMGRVQYWPRPARLVTPLTHVFCAAQPMSYENSLGSSGESRVKLEVQHLWPIG